MRFAKRKTREVRTGIPTWSFQGFKGGGVAVGWLQLDPVWVMVHHKFVSKPCYEDLTDGALKCPRCGVILNTFEMGYLPWVSDAGKPMCSVVKDYSRDILAGIRPGEPIRIRKGDTKFHPVVVERSKHAASYTATAATARTGEQFERWLLTLWKEQPLTDWFNAMAVSEREEPAADPVPVVRPVPVPSSPAGDETDRDWQTTKNRIANKLAGNAVVLGECLPDVRPSMNGKHHKPK